MNTVFDNLIRDLIAGKIDYILIPCNTLRHAEILMAVIREKNIKWNDGDIPNFLDPKFLTTGDTLYCLGYNNFKSIKRMVLTRGPLKITMATLTHERNKNIKYAILHAFAIIADRLTDEDIREFTTTT